jgi:MinD-like ATPase involved in chromosome partitioning or flagellar assembly
MKIIVSILERDTNYLQKITAGLNKRYSNQIEVHAFSELEPALADIKASRIKLLIMSPDFIDRVGVLPEYCTPVCFTESNDVETIHDIKAIGKFQKIDAIYKQILYFYAENNSDVTLKSGGKGRNTCIAFMSPAGGVGSSTMAAAAALYLTRQKKKTIYLNLGIFGVTDAFFSGEGQFDFSDVIYELKKGSNNLHLKLESIVRQDPEGVNFIRQSGKCVDMMELSDENIITLLEVLRHDTDYEYIILDMDFSLNPHAYEIYRYIDRIILVGDGSEVSNEKLVRAREAYRILDQSSSTQLEGKIDVIYNRFGSKTGNVLNDVNALGGAPVIQAAKAAQIVQQIAGMDMFRCLL